VHEISVADPGSGMGKTSDTDPGSGMGENPELDPGSRIDISDPQHWLIIHFLKQSHN